MAKKKEKKETKKKFEYSNEIIGVIIILIAIVGLGNFGPAGNFVTCFAVFLMGTFDVFFLVSLLLIGCYLIIKRELPDFYSSRAIGLYIILISVLILSHGSYIKEYTGDFKILKETWSSMIAFFNSVSTTGTGFAEMFSQSAALENTGGGMIGALFASLFYFLFRDGIYIVVGVLTVLGVTLLFNVSFIDLFKKIKLPKRHHEEHEQIIKDGNEPIKEEIEDKRVVISSMEELTHIKEPADQDIPLKDSDVKVEAPTEEKINVNANYQLPPLSLLKSPKNTNSKDNVDSVKENINLLEKVLNDFDISGKIVECHIGPSVTQYELEIKQGTKVSKLLSIQREIALALAAKEIRIQAPIPGKSTIGIELPNKVNTAVSFKEILSHLPEPNAKNLLAVGLGKDIMGKVKWAEINATPHLLIAGATGSGKSVCINCIIASILMRTKPDEVKLVMVDPKKVELTMYNGIPNLLMPVVTDPKKASIALKNIVAEMEKRYNIFEDTKCKNIVGYNEYCSTHPGNNKMPYIVVIIDELADLMLVAAKEVEDSIMRITQMARAAGIHLIVATQRPSADIITGVIKANIPSRISFAVSSQIDSRTILDMGGAEKLLGKGDMLFLPMGENIPLRIQGAFISDEELEKIVDYTIKQQKAIYDESFTEEKGNSNSVSSDNYEDDGKNDEPLYNEIVDFAVHTGKISASLIQRKYRLGYNRAARIMDLLEERGIVGPQNGSKPREVLVKLEDKDDE